MSDQPKPIKHSEEWREVNNAIAEEARAFNSGLDDCWEKPIASSGICPCCGAEVREDFGYDCFEGEAGEEEFKFMIQECDGCGWNSERLYD